MLDKLRELCRVYGMDFAKAEKHATGPIVRRSIEEAERDAGDAFAKFASGDRLQIVRCLSALNDIKRLKGGPL